MAKSVIFDFDGVLCDSIRECMVVSYHAYWAVKGSPRSQRHGKEAVPNEMAVEFYKYRPLVRIPSEYYHLWNLIDSRVNIDDRRPLSLQNEADFKILDLYQKQFFKERRRWKERDIQGWHEHNPLYSGIKELLAQLTAGNSFYIISAKNEEAILSILQWNGICWDADRVLGAETELDKDALLKQLVEMNNLDVSDVYFVDDNLTNLEMIRRFGVNVLFAAWGYHFAHERDKTQHDGIECLTLDDLRSWVKRVFNSDLIV